MSSLPQNISNFRDVGKTVNDFLGKKLIREGVLFRSAAPDRASPQDQEYLRSSLGIHTIVDFRSRTEILKARQKAENSNGTKQPPQSIPGIQYHDIQVTGRAFENRLLSFLSWWQYFQVIYLYMFGYRVDAVRLVSRAVMVPRGLIGLAGDTIDCSGPALCEALSLLADSETTPALVHCTHGKDRTGLIYALVLMILDVPVDAIEHDYFLSDKLPEVELQKRIRDVREIGLADDWSRTASTLIPFITTHIKEEYGDLNSYLDLNGFDSAQRTKLRDLLLY